MSSPYHSILQHDINHALVDECSCQECACTGPRAGRSVEADMIEIEDGFMAVNSQQFCTNQSIDFADAAEPSMSTQDVHHCSRSTRDHVRELDWLLRYRFAVENENTRKQAMCLVFEANRLLPEGPQEMMESSIMSLSAAPDFQCNDEQDLTDSMIVQGAPRSPVSSAENSMILPAPSDASSARKPSVTPASLWNDTAAMLHGVDTLFSGEEHTEPNRLLTVPTPQRSLTYPLVSDTEAPYYFMSNSTH